MKIYLGRNLSLTPEERTCLGRVPTPLDLILDRAEAEAKLAKLPRHGKLVDPETCHTTLKTATDIAPCVVVSATWNLRTNRNSKTRRGFMTDALIPEEYAHLSFCELFDKFCCARCGTHRSFHNPDAYNPYAKTHCKGFIPIDRRTDVWDKDKEWIPVRVQGAKMEPMVEFAGCIGYGRYPLNKTELREIGDFTRLNVHKWMHSHQGVDWVDILPVKDFRAVCGDIEIPWATEREKELWNDVYGKK